MARCTTLVEAPPEAVWAVLADPAAYADWVVGSRAVRDADEGFPATGTRFHHAVGWGPLTVRDHTEVVDADPPHHLRLRARARPLGTAMVELFVRRDDAGRSRLTLVEDPGDTISRLLWTPVVHLFVRRRNEESLRRLKALAEGLASSP